MKIKVGVFFGGRSVEHEVSVITAVQAAAALDGGRYEAVPVYITKDNRMFYGKALLGMGNYGDIGALLRKCEQVMLVNGGKGVWVVSMRQRLFSSKPKVLAEIDVALLCVHGANVEDGTLQGYLATLGVPFTGCDVYSSALCMNKRVAQTVMRAAGLPVLESESVPFAAFAREPEGTVKDIEGRFEYPVIVKPVNLGSSVGISKAANREGLRAALENVFRFTDEAMVERCVQPLRELNCSVLGDYNGAKASVLEEPVGNDEVLSYADKYLSGGKVDKKAGMASQKRLIPAPIDDGLAERVKQASLDAFHALGCSGLVRIDFLLDGDDFFINEINTIPGSLSFYLWEPAGKKYPQLLDELIALALKRKRESDKLNHSFETNILKGIAAGKLAGTKSGM
jgi:D-alanine-D-alanine ligase